MVTSRESALYWFRFQCNAIEIGTNAMQAHELPPLCLKTTSASEDEISHL